VCERFYLMRFNVKSIVDSPAVDIDYETYYSKSYSVSDLGARAYCTHPEFDPYLVSIFSRELDVHYVGSPEYFDWSSIDGYVWVSHNTLFDQNVYDRCIELSMHEEATPLAWVDTAHLSAYLQAGRSLKAASKILLGRNMDKTVREDMKGKRYRDLSTKEQERWRAYADEDAINSYDIWDQFKHEWPEPEIKISLHTLSMCKRGVAVDLDKVEANIEVLKHALWVNAKKIPWHGKLDAKGKPIKLTSPKALVEECRSCGIPVPSTTAADSPIFEKWYNTHHEQAPFIKAIQYQRRLNRLLKIFETIRMRTYPVGDHWEMQYDLKYFGAHTGRWSGGGGLNVQNLKRDVYFFDADYNFLGTGYEAPENAEFSIDCRSWIVPRPGKKFYICDLAQIEARVVNWLAGNKEFLEKCKTESPYIAWGRVQGYDGPGDKKSVDPKLYAAWKAQVLGCGFQIGAERFVDAAWQLARLKIDINESKRLVHQYRTNNQHVVNLWNKLDRAFKRSWRDKIYKIKLPSGRYMSYFDIVSNQGWKAKVDRSGSRFHFYGGKLTENATQAAARDILRDAILSLECDLGVCVSLHVHDEVVTEVDAGDELTPTIIEEVMSQTPGYMPGLPVGCEGGLEDAYTK